MKNLLIIAMLVLTLVSCKKNDEPIVKEFNLKVSAFNVQVSTFKSYDGDIFSSFTHVYPINSAITFVNTNGVNYQFHCGNFTLETFKFGLR